MKRIKESKKAVGQVVEALEKGFLVIFPCETVYGIAVDSLNPKAVKRLNEYKKRPFGKPYAIMAADQKMAEKYVTLNKTAINLYKNFLPGPLTVISKGKHKVAEGIESEDGTLGVRIPNYPFMLDVIKKFGRPIVATSANASYKKRPYRISDILDNLSQKQKSLIDLIVDAGTLPENEPSTVVDTTLDNPVTLRQGEVRFQKENNVLSKSEENTQNIAKELFQKYESYLGKKPLIFALEGEMGVGKTQFTKGLAKAMGIKETVISPTFNLLLEYNSPTSKNQLTHIDTWRMTNQEELDDLNFIKILEKKNMVVAIEWAEKVIEKIKKERDSAVIIWVKITYGKKENERFISWGNI